MDGTTCLKKIVLVKPAKRKIERNGDKDGMKRARDGEEGGDLGGERKRQKNDKNKRQQQGENGAVNENKTVRIFSIHRFFHFFYKKNEKHCMKL